jgi:hypothetical protein
MAGRLASNSQILNEEDWIETTAVRCNSVVISGRRVASQNFSPCMERRLLASNRYNY